jgi:Mrp family chromosome partitioning ATPase
MPTQTELMDALRQVKDPELGRDIVDLGMVQGLTIDDAGKVAFTLLLTVGGCPLRNQMADNARAALLAVPGVTAAEVGFAAMTEEQRNATFASKSQSGFKLAQMNRIDRVVAVMSGKGGVGKSSLTALLGCAAARRGKKVGILDADVTGPSIPRLFGLPSGGATGSELGILPAITPGGMKVMSVNLLLPDEDTPVLWRGPMISGAIKQFWTDVIWGKLDVLLVDMPPGTSDAALTTINTLPLNGALLVTTPQELASMVVRKGMHMLQHMNVPILGIIENMSYFECPDTGKRHEIFGPGHSDEIASAANAPLLAKLPIHPEVTQLADSGRIEEARLSEMDALAEMLFG